MGSGWRSASDARGAHLIPGPCGAFAAGVWRKHRFCLPPFGKKGDTTCGPNYWVDYLCEDTWYTVYDGNVQAEYAQVLGGGAGTITLEYTVPRGLFQAAGSYRLCVDGLGTVPIDISAR